MKEIFDRLIKQEFVKYHISLGGRIHLGRKKIELITRTNVRWIFIHSFYSIRSVRQPRLGLPEDSRATDF